MNASEVVEQGKAYSTSGSAAVVDTNVYVHALIENSMNYEKARQLLNSLSKRYLPTIVLYEIIWVLRKLGLGKEKIDLAVRSILANPATNIVSDNDGRYTLKAIQILVSEGIDLVHFNDKVVLAVAVNLDLPIATYDSELKKEAKKRGLAIL